MAQKKKSKKLKVINQEYYNQQTAQNAVYSKTTGINAETPDENADSLRRDVGDHDHVWL